METVLSSFKTEIFIKGSGLMELKVEEGFILRLVLVPTTVANGKMGKEMDMAS